MTLAVSRTSVTNIVWPSAITRVSPLFNRSLVQTRVTWQRIIMSIKSSTTWSRVTKFSNDSASDKISHTVQVGDSSSIQFKRSNLEKSTRDRYSKYLKSYEQNPKLELYAVPVPSFSSLSKHLSLISLYISYYWSFVTSILAINAVYQIITTLVSYFYHI